MQKQSALLTSQTVNFSRLASYSSIAVNTARKFMSYMGISYQLFLLHPWSRNQLKRLVKSPKLHFIDPGITRTLSGHSGTLNDYEFESAVISEMYKQIKSWQLPVDIYHLRTVDGREIDFLIETETGYYAFKVKMTSHFRTQDASHLDGLEDILDKPLLAGYVISNDRKLHRVSEKITALPVPWFLG